MTPYQTPQWPSIDRKDHCWRHRGADYKCVLCGAVTKVPPSYPTPVDWVAGKYEKLTEAERAMLPYSGATKL